MMVAHTPTNHGEVSFETDRSRFLGRNRSAANPLAMKYPGKLSGAAGSVLDPCVSARCRIVLPADDVATVDVITGIAATREEALNLIDECEKAGLVHSVSNVAEGFFYVCNCCGCCCGILKGITEYGSASCRFRNACIYQYR